MQARSEGSSGGSITPLNNPYQDCPLQHYVATSYMQHVYTLYVELGVRGGAPSMETST